MYVYIEWTISGQSRILNHVMFGPRIWVEGVGTYTCSSKLLIDQQILMLKQLVYSRSQTFRLASVANYLLLFPALLLQVTNSWMRRSVKQGYLALVCVCSLKEGWRGCLGLRVCRLCCCRVSPRPPWEWGWEWTSPDVTALLFLTVHRWSTPWHTTSSWPTLKLLLWQHMWTEK